MLNGLFGLLLQNKGLLAWIWAHRDDADLFGEEARAAIREYLRGPGISVRRPRAWRETSWSPSRCSGARGRKCSSGRTAPPRLWQTPLRQRTYVAQAAGASRQDGPCRRTDLNSAPRLRDGHATIGSFAVDGGFARVLHTIRRQDHHGKLEVAGNVR